MKFTETIRNILRNHVDGLTPQQLRDLIKIQHPDFYGTESHRRNVEKGHYQDLDHALLAQIYIVPRQAADIYADRSTKPMTLTLRSSPDSSDDDAENGEMDPLETEDLQRLEQRSWNRLRTGHESLHKIGRGNSQSRHHDGGRRGSHPTIIHH